MTIVVLVCLYLTLMTYTLVSYIRISHESHDNPGGSSSLGAYYPYRRPQSLPRIPASGDIVADYSTSILRNSVGHNHPFCVSVTCRLDGPSHLLTG